MLVPFHRILLFYDGSPESHRALRCGAMLAKQMGSETHLLSFIDPGFLTAGLDVLFSVSYEVDELGAKETLLEGLKRLTEWGLIATGHCAVGNAVNEISSLAKFLNSNLIVIGHHAGGFLSRFWTEKKRIQLLNQVTCGVLFEVAA